VYKIWGHSELVGHGSAWGLEDWKLTSSLGFNWDMIHSFDVMWCNLGPWVGPCYILGLVGMIELGPEGL